MTLAMERTRRVRNECECVNCDLMLSIWFIKTGLRNVAVCVCV